MGLPENWDKMHYRRYFAEAFFVQDVAAMDDEELKALPETRALMLSREIYQEENPLKGMTADERAAREAKIAPKVDALFGYIHSLEDSGGIFSDRMKKTVTYAINQEQNLRRFLTDGNIPCDNGHAERVIRSYLVGRANWLFADTAHGAKVNAIMYSVVETAKANRANVPVYLQYLFEQIPLRRARGDKDYMADMMPWPEGYRAYEEKKQQQRRSMYGQLFPEPERPRTPRKRDRAVGMPEGNDLTA